MVSAACAATGVAAKPTFVDAKPRMVVVKVSDECAVSDNGRRDIAHGVGEQCERAGWKSMPILVIQGMDIEFIDGTGKPNGAQPDLTALIGQRMTFDHIGDRVTGTILAAGLGWSKYDDFGTSTIVCAVRLTDGRIVQTTLE